jgi:hypothetical protein
MDEAIAGNAGYCATESAIYRRAEELVWLTASLYLVNMSGDERE